MKHKLFAISTLLLFCVLLFSGVVYSWSTTGGDGTRYAQIRETGVFFNNSGNIMVEGQIVTIDTRTVVSGTVGLSGYAAIVVADSTMGSYITTTTTADASGIVGVVLSTTCANQSSCVVVTKGAADTLVLDSSDPVSINQYVGTSTTRGIGGGWGDAFGNGTGTLGMALEAGDGTDTGKVFVFVNPH